MFQAVNEQINLDFGHKRGRFRSLVQELKKTQENFIRDESFLKSFSEQP